MTNTEALDVLMAAAAKAHRLIDANGDPLILDGPAFVHFDDVAVRQAAKAYVIAELEAAVEGGSCLCGAVDPDYVCAGHKRIAELKEGS